MVEPVLQDLRALIEARALDASLVARELEESKKVSNSHRLNEASALRENNDCLRLNPERFVEVPPQILDVFHSGRQTEQIARTGRIRALDRCTVLDQRFYAAERGRPLP